MNKRWTRWLCAALAASFLIGCLGCGGKTKGETAEQQLLDAYSKKAAALGYDLDIRETDVPDEDSPEEKVTTCFLKKSVDGYDGILSLDVTRTAAGIKTLSLTMIPTKDYWDFDLFRSLAGALMQVCDSSFQQGDSQTTALTNSVAKANNRGEPLERNGKQFQYSLFSSSVYFEVEYPKENYALNARTLAREQGHPLKYLSLSKSAFLRKAREAYGSLGYSIQKSDFETADPGPGLNPNLAETPTVYQLVHEFGNVGGYLLVYSHNQRIYQVAYQVPRYMDSFLSFETGSSVLFSICDPTLDGDPIRPDSDADLLFQQLEADDYVENNGLRYKTPVYHGCITVEAYE